MSARAIAATILTAVLQQGKSLTEVLATHVLPTRDSGFIKAICYGSLRWYGRYEAIVQQLLKKSFKAKEFHLHTLLILGMYQLHEMRVPAYAAIAETVAAARELNSAWATGLLNAVLRTYQRDAERLHAQVNNNIAAQYSHPQWLIQQLQQAWPEQWQGILEANNQAAPMTLRVNLSQLSRDHYLAQLQAVELSAKLDPLIDSALLLDQPANVEILPGFLHGVVSVQDAAAQLAAELLQLAPGQRVLDACAAPGGKTGHILEKQTQLAALVVLEKDQQRNKKITENLTRLQTNKPSLLQPVKSICADANDVSAWWDGKIFDRILLDAPCSATGVIRRHPDIKWQRRSTDIAALVQQQWQLLASLWLLLAPNGILVYATCSILPDENSQLLTQFLREHGDASEVIIDATWGVACTVGRQILPGQNNMDGFYYACLRKLS